MSARQEDPPIKFSARLRHGSPRPRRAAVGAGLASLLAGAGDPLLLSGPRPVRSAAIAAGPRPCGGAPGLRRGFPAGLAAAFRGVVLPGHRRRPPPYRARKRACRTGRCRRWPTGRRAARPAGGAAVAGAPAADAGLAQPPADRDARRRFCRARPVGRAGAAGDAAAARRGRRRRRLARPPAARGDPEPRRRPAGHCRQPRHLAYPARIYRAAAAIPAAGKPAARSRSRPAASSWLRCMAAVRSPQLALDGRSQQLCRDRQGEFSRPGDPDRRPAHRGVAGRDRARQLADPDHPRSSADRRLRQAACGNGAPSLAHRLSRDRRLWGGERRSGDHAAPAPSPARS